MFPVECGNFREKNTTLQHCVCNVVSLFSDHGTLFFCCMGTFFCFLPRYYMTIQKVWKQFKELIYKENKIVYYCLKKQAYMKSLWRNSFYLFILPTKIPQSGPEL